MAIKDREKLKKRWARQYIMRKVRLARDPVAREKLMVYDRNRKRKLRENQRELLNEKQRKNYALGGSARRKLINDGKKRRNPVIGLASLIKDVRAGRRDPRDLIIASSDAIDKCSSFIHRGKRK